MTSAESAMYFNESKFEFNSKPRFDKIVDHAHVLYFMRNKMGIIGI